MKTYALKKLTTKTIILVLLISVVPVLIIGEANAAKLTSRTLLLGDSGAGANTTHSIGFNIVSGSSVGSLEFEYCSNDPYPGEPCTAPTGFDASSAILFSQIGETGFSIHGSSTINKLVLTRVPSIPGSTPMPVGYVFSNIVNPTTPNTTTYVRIRTFASIDATGPATDSGGLAFAIVDGLGVNATVPPFLEFCVGITITSNNCATVQGDTVKLGTISNTSTASGTSKMLAGTNAAGGYAISAYGTTMTSGSNSIKAMATRDISRIGKAQFGMNLRDNSVPDTGSNPTGPGTAVGTTDYNVINEYKFVSGDNVVVNPTINDKRTFTTTYIVNIPAGQKKGNYSTTVSYICFATF